MDAFVREERRDIDFGTRDLARDDSGSRGDEPGEERSQTSSQHAWSRLLALFFATRRPSRYSELGSVIHAAPQAAATGWCASSGCTWRDRRGMSAAVSATTVECYLAELSRLVGHVGGPLPKDPYCRADRPRGQDISGVSFSQRVIVENRLGSTSTPIGPVEHRT